MPLVLAAAAGAPEHGACMALDACSPRMHCWPRPLQTHAQTSMYRCRHTPICIPSAGAPCARCAHGPVALPAHSLLTRCQQCIGVYMYSEWICTPIATCCMAPIRSHSTVACRWGGKLVCAAYRRDGTKLGMRLLASHRHPPHPHTCAPTHMCTHTGSDPIFMHTL